LNTSPSPSLKRYRALDRIRNTENHKRDNPKFERKRDYKNIMRIKNIGRLALFKWSVISALVFFVFPVIIALTYQLFTKQSISVTTFYNNLRNDLKGNEIFVIVQIFVILLGIWVFGGIASWLIIKKKRNRFFISWLTIFSLWILLFFSSAITAGINDFSKYRQNGFMSELTGWLAYGLTLYIVLGAVHGLIFGHFLGREILKIGLKENAL